MTLLSGQNGLNHHLAKAAKGDAAAWRALVDAFWPRVYGLLVRLCGDRELAEEITKDTFVKLVTQLTKAAGYREQGRFESYLFRIAINRLRDEMRRRQRQARTTDFSAASPAASQLASASEDPLGQVQQVEQVQLLRSFVARLPEADKEVLHLRHTAGLSFQQIAQTLHQPLGTVLARSHRALVKLRKMMGDKVEWI